MAHHHGRIHQLVQRQAFRQGEEQEEEQQREQKRQVETVVNVIFKTMPQTFTGKVGFFTQSVSGIALVPPAIRTTLQVQPTSKPKDEPARPTDTPKPSASQRPPQSQRPASSARSTTQPEVSEITAVPTNIQNAGSSIAVASGAPPLETGALAATGIASATPTAAAAAGASQGMSAGAKAGIALGALAAVGMILSLILLVYHGKKKEKRALQKMDDEKTAMRELPPPPPPVVNVRPAVKPPSAPSQLTMSTAPRLSLRPVTQFSPTFQDNGKTGGNLLNASAVASPTTTRPGTAGSAWERRGASNASSTSPVDPFSDPQTSSPKSPQNPFSNNAAIDSTAQASVPSTPHSANDLFRDPEMNGFPTPVPIVAAAAAAVPVQKSKVSDEKELPPPGMNREANAIPSSPAWTDDIPASPGPAPTGPPPVAAPDNVHRVQLDFMPSMQDELELRAGQLVRMLHEYDDGWALCLRMDRSQQGVVPRTCISKHPVKPRNGPPRLPPPGQRPRGPPINSPMGPGPLTPSSPHPTSLSPASGPNSPPTSPPQQQSRDRSNSNVPSSPFAPSPHPRSLSPGPQIMRPPQNRGRSSSNAPSPFANQPRSMSPGPYGGGPQPQLPQPQMGRPRSNSAGNVQARKAAGVGLSPMNPNAGQMQGQGQELPIPSRKPVPGLAL